MQREASGFRVVAHVLSELERRRISPTGRLLGLVLAYKVRRTAGDRWLVWRGRESLGKLTGLCTKTVSKARRELVNAGIFCEHFDRQIRLPSGESRPVAKGVIVLELVQDVDAFVSARDKTRSRQNDEIEKVTRLERLKVQKRTLQGQITDVERSTQERAIRDAARREHHFPPGNVVPPSDMSEQPARNGTPSPRVENLVRRWREKGLLPDVKEGA